MFRNIILNKFKFYFILFLICAFVAPAFLYAQQTAFTPGLGFIFPFGTNFGFINGTHLKVDFGRDFDESVFYGIGCDLSFIGIRWSKMNSIYKDSSTVLFPLYGSLRVRFPVVLPFSLFSNVGAGFSFLFDFVSPSSISNQIDSKMFLYSGFYWFAGVGIGFMLGSRTDGQIYLQFSSSNLKTNANDSNYPFYEKFNLFSISIIFQIRFFKI